MVVLVADWFIECVIQLYAIINSSYFIPQLISLFISIKNKLVLFLDWDNNVLVISKYMIDFMMFSYFGMLIKYSGALIYTYNSFRKRAHNPKHLYTKATLMMNLFNLRISQKCNIVLLLNRFTTYKCYSLTQNYELFLKFYILALGIVWSSQMLLTCRGSTAIRMF